MEGVNIDSEDSSNTLSNLPEGKHYNASEGLSSVSAFQTVYIETDLEMSHILYGQRSRDGEERHKLCEKYQFCHSINLGSDTVHGSSWLWS